MICENCGMLTTPYKDGSCELGDHRVIKTSKPQTIEGIFDEYWNNRYYNEDSDATIKAKAAIQAMLEDIIGRDESYADALESEFPKSLPHRNSLKVEQRQRATKYNLTLQGKE